MQFPDLFQILADFLSFVADFLSVRGMDKYLRQETVDAGLAAYFVTGVLIAYLFATAKRFPGYEWLLRRARGRRRALVVGDVDPIAGHGADMARYAIVSILGAIVGHVLLVAASRLLGGEELGGLRVTMNAALAWNAVYHPLNAMLQLARRSAEKAHLARLLRPGAGRLLVISLGVLPHLLNVYWIYALAAVHGTTVPRMALLFGLSVGGILLVGGIGFAMFTTDNDIEPANGPAAAA